MGKILKFFIENKRIFSINLLYSVNNFASWKRVTGKLKVSTTSVEKIIFWLWNFPIIGFIVQYMFLLYQYTNL